MFGWLVNIVARATLFDWAILVGGVGVLLYWLGTWNYDHFRLRGMPYRRPVPFLGNMAGVTFRRISFFDFVLDLYKQFEGHRVIGLFQSLRPTLLIRDPELVKIITIKEFDHFVDHQLLGSEKVDPLFTSNLFNLKGQKWRDIRATLSPAFTASKMRNIFKLIDLCGEQTHKFLEEKIKSSNGGVYEAEMKDFFTRFANDVIATSAFGIECDSLRQPENEFYRMGRLLTNMKGTRALIFLGYVIAPKLMEFLRVPINSPKERIFFHNLVHDTINERQKKGIFRPDMLQLLMQARDGQLKAEAGDEQENIKNSNIQKLTDLDITAQAVIFFFAGFDTVSTTMSFCSYSLARHPQVQERVQQEIDEVFEKHGGKLTYEATQELTYTDMFISEVLRLYSSMPLLNRTCTKNITLPARGNVPAYTVREGDLIWIPMIALHRDPKYWEDPEKFDPQRFSEENKHKIQPFTYMPFGIGPRGCIGNRFATMEVKVALAHILRNFSFKTTAKTPKKVEYPPNDLSGSIKGGFWVGLTKRIK